MTKRKIEYWAMAQSSTPKAQLESVLEAAVEQEKFEGWIVNEVRSGVPLPGLYPANAETKARYEAFRTEQTKNK